MSTKSYFYGERSESTEVDETVKSAADLQMSQPATVEETDLAIVEAGFVEFDLTSWRPCRVAYETGSAFVTIQHGSNPDGTGSSKAIEIPLMRLSIVFDNLKKITAALEEVSAGHRKVDLLVHIGGGYHVRVTDGYTCVHIRKYREAKWAKRELAATKDGISLRKGEWMNLAGIAKDISDAVKLEEVEPCYASTSHCNQEGYYTCQECCPYRNEMTAQFY